MLNINFEIRADHGDCEEQARAVISALVSLYGSTILPTSGVRYGGKLSDNLAQAASIPEWVAPAPDGYPQPQPPADNDHVAPGATPFPTGDHDTAGTPWDERIHASTKTTNKDGTWTRRRNTPDATFDAVMAELKGAAPAVPPAPEPEPTAAEAFTPPASVVIPPAPAATPAPAPAAATSGAPSFIEIMNKVTAGQRSGKLDPATLNGLLAQCGLEGVAKLVSADEGTRAAVDALLSAALA